MVSPKHEWFLEEENEQLDENFPWSRRWRIDHLDLDGILSGRVVDACLMLLGDFFAGRHLDGKAGGTCNGNTAKLV